MAEDLIIIGAGGFGREVSLLVEDINEAQIKGPCWNLLGFIDDDSSKWGKKMRGYKVLGGSSIAAEMPDNTCYICAIGDPVAKLRAVNSEYFVKKHFVNLVHPDVALSAEVKMGCGVIINKGAILTIAIHLGNHVAINPGCGIGHDAVIDDYSTLFWRVNVSGNVKIGQECLIGTGATILQGLSLGDKAVIGAGAVVTEDIPAGCTAVGVPAKYKASKDRI